jgi:hypothetical protein
MVACGVLALVASAGLSREGGYVLGAVRRER